MRFFPRICVQMRWPWIKRRPSAAEIACAAALKSSAAGHAGKVASSVGVYPS